MSEWLEDILGPPKPGVIRTVERAFLRPLDKPPRLDEPIYYKMQDFYVMNRGHWMRVWGYEIERLITEFNYVNE